MHSFPSHVTPIIHDQIRSLIKVTRKMKSKHLMKAFGLFKPIKNETHHFLSVLNIILLTDLWANYLNFLDLIYANRK